MATMVNILDPDVIVLGGGLSNVERLYRDLPPLVEKYGFNLGGPAYIPKVFNGRNRAFFFVNYEEFRLPEQSLRTRTIFNPHRRQGSGC